MRDLPTDLARHLASATTTLCWCWRLTRRDGIAIGFTDHDRDLDFEGTTFEAAAGFTASEIAETTGLGVDNLEVEGALSSGRLTEAELAAGLFDEAKVEIWRVNWSNPEQRLMIKVGTLGEVRRAGQAFSAEIRGLSHELQRPTGRLFQYTCDADLGDHRCRVDISAPSFMAEGRAGKVVGTSELEIEGIDHFAAGWLTRGLMEVRSGSATGYRVEIRAHEVIGGAVRLALWQPVPSGLAVGDVIRASAGCDKLPVTCAAKFGNIKNFRGFPHMPGNDFVAAIARPGAPVRGSAAS